MEPHGTVVHGALDEAELAMLGLHAEQLIDFSSNINPFGPPATVLAAYVRSIRLPIPTEAVSVCANSWRTCIIVIRLRC